MKLTRVVVALVHGKVKFRIESCRSGKVKIEASLYEGLESLSNLWEKCRPGNDFRIFQ
jgi:SH3-like domain-containing protein